MFGAPVGHVESRVVEKAEEGVECITPVPPQPFLASLPALRTDTRAIDGRIADYVIVVREAAGGTWWAGALTEWTPRELSLPLAFLPGGTFNAEIWQDGPNAARYALDWQHVTRQVTATDTLPIRMAPGGGWVARIRLNR